MKSDAHHRDPRHRVQTQCSTTLQLREAANRLSGTLLASPRCLNSNHPTRIPTRKPVGEVERLWVCSLAFHTRTGESYALQSILSIPMYLSTSDFQLCVMLRQQHELARSHGKQ